MRLVVALVVWTLAAVGAVEVSTVVADSIHSKPSSSSDPSATKATDSASLFRTPNFTRALGTARAHLGAGAKLENVALYPGYLAVIAVRKGGESDIAVYPDGRYVQTDTGATPGTASVFPLARIKANVPEALAQRIARAAHMPQSQLHYMVLEVDPVSHKLRWLVYPVQGTSVEYFVAAGTSGPLLEYRRNSSSGLQRVSG